MLVSQMQSCTNAKFPLGVRFGEACLSISEAAARGMGFKEICVYSAKEHPIFREHPENWGQIGEEFVYIFDMSAKKLGYDGSRNSHHVKSLVNHH